MANQKNFRSSVILLLCFIAAVTLLVLGGPPAITTMRRQEDDDETRQLWNKQFLKAREEAKKPRPNAQTVKAEHQTAVKPNVKPGEVGAGYEAVDGELIGVTIRRLRP